VARAEKTSQEDPARRSKAGGVLFPKENGQSGGESVRADVSPVVLATLVRRVALVVVIRVPVPVGVFLTVGDAVVVRVAVPGIRAVGDFILVVHAVAIGVVLAVRRSVVVGVGVVRVGAGLFLLDIVQPIVIRVLLCVGDAVVV